MEGTGTTPSPLASPFTPESFTDGGALTSSTSASSSGFMDSHSSRSDMNMSKLYMVTESKDGKKSIKERMLSLRIDLKNELENYEILQQLESGTGIKKLDMVSYFGILFSISVIMGYGAKQWCDLVGFCYPAYATFRALGSKEKGPVIRWITYWVTLSFLNIVELALGNALLRICPFYYPFKFGFVIWCQSPQKRGSLYVHSHILAPFLKCHEASLPSKLQK